MPLAHLLGGVDALRLEGWRHPDIRDDDMGMRLGRAGDQLVVVARHAHDFDVVGEAEERANPLPHDEVVIGEENSDPSVRHMSYWAPGDPRPARGLAPLPHAYFPHQ